MPLGIHEAARKRCPAVQGVRLCLTPMICLTRTWIEARYACQSSGYKQWAAWQRSAEGLGNQRGSGPPAQPIVSFFRAPPFTSRCITSASCPLPIRVPSLRTSRGSLLTSWSSVSHAPPPPAAFPLPFSRSSFPIPLCPTFPTFSLLFSPRSFRGGIRAG